MISILLIILKIIGITLLVILGLVLFLFLIVLFVPVRYRFKGNYDDAFHCKGKITWLLHFISIKIEVEKEVVTSIRILGIPLSVFLKKKKEGISSKDEMTEDSQSKKEDTVQPAEKQETLALPSSGQIEDNVDSFIDIDNQREIPEGNGEESQPEKRSVFQKLLDIYQNIKQKITDCIHKVKNIIQKIKEFICNIKDKKKQLKRYLRILQSDTTKAAFALCKNKIFKILKHIFPRKLHAELTFGFDDPSTTGYTLAVYGMLPEYVGKNIILHPDFDKQFFCGQFKVKGAIRAWTLLYQVLGILFDKNCRKLYHVVKKEISNEHK